MTSQQTGLSIICTLTPFPPQAPANGQPLQTAPAPAATLKEVGEAHDNIQRLQTKAQDGELSLEEQRDLDHSEKVLAQTRVKNLEREQQVIRSLPQPRELGPHKTQVLADAKAVLKRPVPGEPQPAPASSPQKIPDDTTGTDDAAPPGNSGQPSLASASVPPSAPPLSVETSQKLIHNVMNRPHEARQHPKVLADVAQAQRVVQEHVQRLESQAGPLSEGQRRELGDANTALGRLAPSGSHVAGISAEGPSMSADNSNPNHSDGGAVQARWKPSKLHPLHFDFKAAEKWRAELKAQVKANPVSIHEVVSAWTLASPDLTLSQRKVYSAAQTLLDMLPPDMVKNLRPFEFKVHTELLEDAPAMYLAGANAIALSQKLMEKATPDELRGYLWHELGHWLYFNAHRDPRAFRWRVAIDQHWRKRTQGRPVDDHPKGYKYVRSVWISDYAGKKYPGRPGGIELPSVYLEKAALGPEELARICRNKSFMETFKIVLSIFNITKP